MSNSDSKRVSGFTLIELMVALVVLAILAAIAFPSFRGMLMDANITSQANGMVGSLALARSEAVKRGVPVSICASRYGTACTGSTHWHHGYIVFIDQGTAGTVDGTDTILQVVSGNSDKVSVVSAASYVQYAGTGLLAKGDDIDSPVVEKAWISRMLAKLSQFFVADAYASGGSGHGGGGGSGSSGVGGGTGGSGSTTTPTASFTVCDNIRTGETGRLIEVAATGRTTMSTTTCN